MLLINYMQINARVLQAAGRPALTHHPHPHHPMCTPPTDALCCLSCQELALGPTNMTNGDELAALRT
jgi:hypothetical protein